MTEILQQNYLKLVTEITQQEFICNMLIERQVLIRDDKELILAKPTNSGRNSLLVDYIRCRFQRAFPVLCEALLLTKQVEILSILNPDMTLPPGKKVGSTKCNICCTHDVSIAFEPCGHVCCTDCASQLNSCHMCRTSIRKKLTLFFP